GHCSTTPIESTRAGLPVRSANKEVDDGATCGIQTSDDGPTGPRREPRSGQEEEWCSMKRMGLARGLVAVAAMAIIAGACNAAPGASGGTGGQSCTIGFSNPSGVGNGWREAMLCSAKAEAVKTGEVTKVTIIHHDTDAHAPL